MIRRVVASLAALAVGIVILGPVGEVLFYGLEGFPVGADAKGVIRILSASGAVLLLLIGAAVGARVTGPLRGWPLVAMGLLVAGALVAFAPLDVDSAFGELHPLIRPVAALAGGIAIGAAAVAVLPSTPGGGDPWPIAAFSAGIVVGTPVALISEFASLRYTIGWADLASVVLAVAAAVVAPRPSTDPRTPGVGTIARIALLGVVVSAPFHMEYVRRAAEESPAGVVVLVLLLTMAVWVVLTGALVRWSGRTAGADAGRFALTIAGATAVLFTASGRNMGVAWGGTWVQLLGIVGAVAGVLLTRRRPDVPWDACGIAGSALVAVVVGTATIEPSGLVAAGVPLASFALGAALARTTAAGALLGLLTALLTLPVLIGVVTHLQQLLVDDPESSLGLVDRVVLYAPIWLVGLLTAALLARRPAPTPLTVG
ncbi:hypothetical protein O7635_20660 [Asanoa sp. WMMD1127]|uniref:hypothetical protein n=1 Tax=Asanoa sp. WMMD1127 TaxID=3016107 RepID=UPI002416BEE0|nr:hypothetical protein [Asanoa sp. WMMD1127]MDG4824270.1 hypothetical protein [Asanoa sp. WMMD1127]